MFKVILNGCCKCSSEASQSQAIICGIYEYVFIIDKKLQRFDKKKSVILFRKYKFPTDSVFLSIFVSCAFSKGHTSFQYFNIKEHKHSFT